MDRTRHEGARKSSDVVGSSRTGNSLYRNKIILLN